MIKIKKIIEGIVLILIVFHLVGYLFCTPKFYFNVEYDKTGYISVMLVSLIVSIMTLCICSIFFEDKNNKV